MSQNNGNGLIIGGAVVTALGIGALVMVPVGSIRGNEAEEAFNEAQAILDVDPDDPQALTDRERAEFDGQQANAILIAGAVLFPLLLAGGATMIAFGVKAKMRSRRSAAKLQLTPSLGRRSVGFSLSGKF